MSIVPEMQRLRDILDERGIKWVDKSMLDDPLYIARTHFKVKGFSVSVINGFGTYGGISYGGNNHGFLEVYSGLTGNEPVG